MMSLHSEITRHEKSVREQMAASVARVLRLIRDRPKSESAELTRDERSVIALSAYTRDKCPTTWESAWVSIANRANEINSQAKRDRTTEGLWSKKAHQISNNLKTRKGAEMTAKADRITPKDILQLLETQQYRCAYTGEELTPDNVSADHIIPLKRGGEHSLKNICLVTRAANQAKGTLALDEFRDLCRKVVTHNPESQPAQNPDGSYDRPQI